MARKRMIDPSFWEDEEVATLTRDERLLLLGCIQFSDDEGRIRAHPSYLKSSIFMYDDELDLEATASLASSMISKMDQWNENNPWRCIRYDNNKLQYLAFPLWFAHQAPTHPQPSQLPPPPTGGTGLDIPFTDKLRQEVYERDDYTCQYCGTEMSGNPRQLSIDHVIPLTRGGSHHRSNLVTACKSCNLKKRNRTPEEAGMCLIQKPTEDNDEVNPDVNPKVNHDVKPMQTQYSLGQSSLGQSSIGKVSIGNGVPFSQLLTDLKKTDLTDPTVLQGALTKAGESSEKVAVEVVLHVWENIVGGKYTAEVFNDAAHAVRTYPPGILAQGLLKAKRYNAKKWSYIEKCLQEMLEASHK